MCIAVAAESCDGDKDGHDRLLPHPYGVDVAQVRILIAADHFNGLHGAALPSLPAP